jgi:hypothetical protein
MAYPPAAFAALPAFATLGAFAAFPAFATFPVFAALAAFKEPRLSGSGTVIAGS